MGNGALTVSASKDTPDAPVDGVGAAGSGAGPSAAIQDLPTEAELTAAAAGLPLATAIDLVGILSGVEETAYAWDMVTDTIDWESNVGSVLGVRSVKEIATGGAFQFLIAAEHVTRRQSAFSPDTTNNVAVDDSQPVAAGGHPYRVHYRFLPQGRRSTNMVWIEDHGRWWPDDQGRPARARGVIRVLNESYAEEKRALHRNDQDELTGQLNRIRLTEALAAVIARSERTRQPSAFMIASINNLAVINENFGFDVGDAVISSVGHVIQQQLRGGDTLGRYSANKFGVILNECGPGAMQIAAERLLKAVRQSSFKSSDCPISSTISIGAVQLPSQAHNVPTAVSRALQALEKARNIRHDAYVAWEPSPARESARLRNIKIANDVAAALEENRMHLVLQPVVRSGSHEPAFYECLLRMLKPDGTVIGAGEFIEFAEQLGMSRLIDRRTLELAIDLLKKNPEVTLSLNVSSLTCGDPEWLVLLHRLTGGQARITKRLIVEITETTAIGDLDQTIAFVDTLKEMGCRVAIDDFGAGYTSFRNLKHLNCDVVKIDGAFVKNLVSDASDRVFVRMMAELSQAFGMETVAEWVTDGPTAEIAESLGITYLQGFHFGRPIEADALPGPSRRLAAVG
jgi:diguanylate cyclase (GGDEF)-like protein